VTLERIDSRSPRVNRIGSRKTSPNAPLHIRTVGSSIAKWAHLNMIPYTLFISSDDLTLQDLRLTSHAEWTAQVA
jgi:hypothetical protein